MHELAVCQQLLSQVEEIAKANGATTIHMIRVSVGPLSGIEAPLLEQAFSIARSGTIADQSTLEIDQTAVSVCCRSCGVTGETAPNMLLCSGCGDWKVDVINGAEMMLMSVELSGMPESDPPPGQSPPGQQENQTEDTEYV